MKRSILQLACVFCLLFAQHVAFTHATWHAHGAAAAHQQDRNDEGSAERELCTLHGLFGQVVGCAPGIVVQLAVEDPVSERVAYLPQALRPATPLTPRSRGPPSLL
jgi:hypothetical protein